MLVKEKKRVVNEIGEFIWAGIVTGKQIGRAHV